ncbi:hypothetical protein L0U85_10030 [Glycomyces sp. L485]|uniref:hypothetical protein n=1 Tax=Glycomyces sp. L485 TaxID=2909235 RepID=UPI001F4B7DBC|nr:hypothetical protein [Glycomyces sp. L485]MCH7231186.1 hypothetical protein [Glycomyces sp. L485]
MSKERRSPQRDGNRAGSPYGSRPDETRQTMIRNRQFRRLVTNLILLTLVQAFTMFTAILFADVIESSVATAQAWLVTLLMLIVVLAIMSGDGRLANQLVDVAYQRSVVTEAQMKSMYGPAMKPRWIRRVLGPAFLKIAGWPRSVSLSLLFPALFIIAIFGDQADVVMRFLVGCGLIMLGIIVIFTINGLENLLLRSSSEVERESH